MSDRYIRQKKLQEIGNEGQLKLTHSTVVVPVAYENGPAKEYLLRSGIGLVVVGDQRETPEFPHSFHFQFETCRTFAHGAWFATRRIAEIVGL
jgi:hypothetical protein